MSHFHCATIIVYRAERIAPSAERHNFRFTGNQSLEIVPIKLSRFRVHLRHFQGQTPFGYQRLPRRHVRMMLEFGDDDLVTASQRATKGPRQVIDHRRRVRTKDNFVGSGVQKIRKRVTR